MTLATEHGILEGTVSFMFVDDKNVEEFNFNVKDLYELLKSASAQYKLSGIIREQSTAEQLLKWQK